MVRRAWGYCVGLAWLTGCAASGDDGGLDGFAEASATITEGASSGMGETEGAEQSGTLGASGDGDGDGDPGGDGDASSSGDGDGDGDPGGDGDASSSGDGDGDGDPSGDGDASSSGDGDGDGDPGGDGDGDPPPPDETTCASAAQSLTSAGCRFAPIVGNPSSETFMGPLPWAVIAANPNAFATTARLYAPSGALLETATVDPLGSHVFELDGPASQTWEHKKASGVSDLAFLLESDTPITAYQYQPYSTSFSATADGSLLLPEHAWNTNYLMVEASAGPQWLTVVSLQDGTEVTVRRDAAAVGSTDSGGGVPALAAGDEHTEILDAQQTLRVYSSGSDLSGTAIFSSTNDPFAVIAGSPGMSLPTSSASFNDYLEEQLPPRSAWGTSFAVLKFQSRGGETDLYRIIADKDGAVVTVTGGPNTAYNLNQGEFVEFQSAEDFTVESTEAILIAHMLTSCSNASGTKDPTLYPGGYEASANCGTSTDADDLGDPALSFITPRDQWRGRYTFAAPGTYAWDIVTVVAESFVWPTIALDGGGLPLPENLPGTSLVSATFAVGDGAHVIESTAGSFGLEVYGYDCRVSYAYAGGLSLGIINTPPAPQ